MKESSASMRERKCKTQEKKPRVEPSKLTEFMTQDMISG
jgi:hypothetical protein